MARATVTGTIYRETNASCELSELVVTVVRCRWPLIEERMEKRRNRRKRTEKGAMNDGDDRRYYRARNVGGKLQGIPSL